MPPRSPTPGFRSRICRTGIDQIDSSVIIDRVHGVGYRLLGLTDFVLFDITGKAKDRRLSRGRQTCVVVPRTFHVLSEFARQKRLPRSRFSEVIAGLPELSYDRLRQFQGSINAELRGFGGDVRVSL